MRIRIDSDQCIASGACVLANPEVFAQDEDGFVVLLDQSPPADLADKAHEAAGACPAMVIHIDD